MNFIWIDWRNKIFPFKYSSHYQLTSVVRVLHGVHENLPRVEARNNVFIHTTAGRTAPVLEKNKDLHQHF